MSRSWASITPASWLSATHADLFFGHRGDFILPRPNRRSTSWVVLDSSQTKGRASLANQLIGIATRPAMASEQVSARRLGTSSPKISVMKVIRLTPVRYRCCPRTQTRHQPLDPAGEGLAQRLTAEVAGQHADHGDADLHGGQEALRLLRQLQRLGRALGGGSHLLQAALARGHDRHLGHGEEAVQQNKREDNQDHFKHGRRPRLVAGRAGACDGGRRSGTGSGAAQGIRVVVHRCARRRAGILAKGRGRVATACSGWGSSAPKGGGDTRDGHLAVIIPSGAVLPATADRFLNVLSADHFRFRQTVLHPAR